MKERVNRMPFICYKNKKNKCFTAWYDHGVYNESNQHNKVIIYDSLHSGYQISRAFEDELIQMIGTSNCHYLIRRTV